MYLADLESLLDVLDRRLAPGRETPVTIAALSKYDHADHNHPAGPIACAALELRALTWRSVSSTTTDANSQPMKSAK